MNILIIGASGYLGDYLYAKVSSIEKHMVKGTCCSSISEDYIKCNVLDVNDTRFIYLSTTIGVGKCQGEDVEPKRRRLDEYLCHYVNGKIDGELIVEGHHNHVIIRPGSIYGFDRHGSYDKRMEVLLNKSETGEAYIRTDNYYTSFVHIDDLTSSILELMENDYTGKTNIAGELPVSYYKFNRHLAGVIGIDNEFIVPEYLDKTKFNTLSAEHRKKVLKTDIREVIV